MKRVMTIGIVIVTFVLYAAHSYAADKPSIYYGSLLLSLGMDQDDVMEKIKKDDLSASPIASLRGQETSFYISTKSTPVENYGQIIFKDKRIVYVSKDCTPKPDDAVSAIKTIHRILSAITKNEASTGLISTSTFSQPGYEYKHTKLHLEGYEIQISLYDGPPNLQAKPYTIYYSIADHEALGW